MTYPLDPICSLCMIPIELSCRSNGLEFHHKVGFDPKVSRKLPYYPLSSGRKGRGEDASISAIDLADLEFSRQSYLSLFRAAYADRGIIIGGEDGRHLWQSFSATWI